MDVRVTPAQALTPRNIASMENWQLGMRLDQWGALDDEAMSGHGTSMLSMVFWRSRLAAVCTFDPESGDIRSLASTESGRGLGAQALAAAEDYLRRRGIREAFVEEVLPGSAAFYRRKGLGTVT